MKTLLFKIRFLLLLPFLFFAFWALKWTVADTLALISASYEERWLEQGYVPKLSEWQEAEDLLQLALELNTDNPDYYEMLGKYYTWRIFVEDKPLESDEELIAVIEQGLSYFRAAIGKRPTWPLGWGFLLEAKSAAGQIDEEFWQIWKQTARLGGREGTVQVKMLEAGLSHWELFNDGQRQQVVDIFTQMMSKPFDEGAALVTANTYGALSLFCDLVEPEKHSNNMSASCNSLVSPDIDIEPAAALPGPLF